MKIGTTFRTTITGLMLLAAPLAGAQSRWGVGAFGVAEYDTEQTVLVLGGLSASPGGMGIAPLIGVQAYALSYDVGTDRQNVFTVRPYAGLRSGFEGGSLYGTVGYAFANRDNDEIGGIVAADRGSGVVASAGWDHWGTNGAPWGFQALGSYNFGSESYWTRARATRRLGASAPAQTRFGGEVALLGGDNYTAWQPGLVMEWHNGEGRIFGLGAGAKLVDEGDNAAYVKAEISFPLVRR